MKYPFIDKVKQALSEKKESFEWLANQIGKSRRWIYNQSLEELSLEVILKLTEALEFNLLEDYNSWRQAQNEHPLFLLNEPAAKYIKQPKKLNIDFRISTTLNNAELNSSKVLHAIRTDCEKYGYDFELL